MKTVDRRIVKTRELLQHALMELILEKGYSAITVQDILDRANVGRSTFYSHYPDKEALLHSGFEDLFDLFRHTFQQDGQAPLTEEAARQLTLLIFRHAEQQRPLFKALMGERGSHQIHQNSQHYLSQVARGYLEAAIASARGRPQPSVPVEMIVQYVTSTFLALLMWWLDKNSTLNAEEMNEAYWNLVIPGIQKSFN